MTMMRILPYIFARYCRSVTVFPLSPIWRIRINEENIDFVLRKSAQCESTHWLHSGSMITQVIVCYRLFNYLIPIHMGMNGLTRLSQLPTFVLRHQTNVIRKRGPYTENAILTPWFPSLLRQTSVIFHVIFTTCLTSCFTLCQPRSSS